MLRVAKKVRRKGFVASLEYSKEFSKELSPRTLVYTLDWQVLEDWTIKNLRFETWLRKNEMPVACWGQGETWKLFLRSLKVLQKTSVVELLLIKPRNCDPTIYFLKNFLNFRSKFLKLAQQLFLKTPWKHCFENILPQPQQKNLYEIMVILSTVWNHGKESLSVT